LSQRFETTVQRPVEASGVGLHSGAPVQIRILPAPVSTGIVFVRTDLDNFPIPASWRHVARVSYATSLMRQGVLISTTEHLLSVFYSMGIDNVYVEIDNLEVPILDGSGLPFVRLIERPAFASTGASAVTFASAVRFRLKIAASASPSFPTTVSASPAIPTIRTPWDATPSNSK
jgi:UDP-3-O-acyl-N-acetylglucosamine deacetylase